MLCSCTQTEAIAILSVFVCGGEFLRKSVCVCVCVLYASGRFCISEKHTSVLLQL